MCSYGYGGTIAHVLLEEAPAPTAIETPKAASLHVIPVSGRSASRLSANAEALGGPPAFRASLADRGGRHAVVAAISTSRCARPSSPRTCKELIVGLDAVSNGERNSSVATGSVVPGAADGAVWVCSGHGSHWVGMGAELLREEPEFAAVIDAIDPIFATELGFSARAALAGGGTAAPIRCRR